MPSLPDVYLPRNKWVNLYTSTGIDQGSSLIIQNKSRSRVQVWESSDTPAPNLRSGETLERGERTRVMEDSVGVWVISRSADGSVFVQKGPSQ